MNHPANRAERLRVKHEKETKEKRPSHTRRIAKEKLKEQEAEKQLKELTGV